MGMEEDLHNTLKYASFSGKADPLKMMSKMLKNLEMVMLKRMESQISSRLKILTKQGEEDKDLPLDPFEILGVNQDSTQEEVTKAYREKAFKAHPDKGGSVEEMAKVNAAKETIFMFKGWK